MPTAGLKTLTQCKFAGLKGIVLKSKKNVFLERKKCISFANRNNLPFVEIPIEITLMEYFLIWHKSDEGDGGHIWMKDLIIRAFKDAQR